MGEAKAKFVKVVNADNIKKIKQILAANSSSVCGTARRVLDTICMMILNDTGASFAKNGEDIFASDVVYSKKIKECSPVDRDRQWLQNVAKSVNMDADGNKGDLLAAVSDPASAADMIHFFPHFKILFKFAQLGMTLTKQTSLENKV